MTSHPKARGCTRWCSVPKAWHGANPSAMLR